MPAWLYCLLSFGAGAFLGIWLWPILDEWATIRTTRRGGYIKPPASTGSKYSGTSAGRMNGLSWEEESAATSSRREPGNP